MATSATTHANWTQARPSHWVLPLVGSARRLGPCKASVQRSQPLQPGGQGEIRCMAHITCRASPEMAAEALPPLPTTSKSTRCAEARSTLDRCTDTRPDGDMAPRFAARSCVLCRSLLTGFDGGAHCPCLRELSPEISLLKDRNFAEELYVAAAPLHCTCIPCNESVRTCQCRQLRVATGQEQRCWRAGFA
jgi:hypothetical protein